MSEYPDNKDPRRDPKIKRNEKTIPIVRPDFPKPRPVPPGRDATNPEVEKPVRLPVPN
jgi:hypothetical protein